MSGKLSPALKALLVASHARGSAIPASAKLDTLFDSVYKSAKSVGLGRDTVLTLSTAALITLNSPQSLAALYTYSTKSESLKTSIERAALMREAGLKCISFSGIPRTINGLGALRASLSLEVQAGLPTAPTREVTPENVVFKSKTQALALWNNVYEPHSTKLLTKLAESHPDLPVHILSSHYGPNLSDPESAIASSSLGKVGRVLTSVVAVACLRAQQGVSPQVASHIFGLRNSKLPNSGAEKEPKIEGVEFLTSDEGAMWLLHEVDRIVAVVTEGQAPASFAGPRESKL